MKAGVGQIEPERVFPVNPAAHGIGSLTVTEVLEELENRDQGQTPCRQSGLASGGVQVAEVLVLVERAELVAQPHDHGALGKGGPGNTYSLAGNLTDRFHTQAHGSPPVLDASLNSPTVSRRCRRPTSCRVL